MNLLFFHKKRYFLLCIPLLLFQVAKVNAQLGTNPTDTVYGLTTSGQITAISVNTAGNVTIGTPAVSAANANGMGWNYNNKKFYFFNQCGSGTTEFVSFDPITGVKSTLAIPSSPVIPTNQKIRSGTVTPNGTGYFTIFPGATTTMGYATNNPAFYYYSIPTNTWTLVSQDFRNTSNTNVANLATLNSGDMTFDGAGNLWMIASNSADFALYRINAPIPTAAGSIIHVDTMIAQTPTPGGVSFTGIAFNSLGVLYMSTGSGGGANNNKLYKLTASSTTPVYVGTFTNGYGDDLTSTVYPNSVLPSVWVDFNAVLAKDHVNLTWKVNETDRYAKYNVEYSKDGSSWQHIGVVNNKEGIGQKKYTYTDGRFNSKSNYYRIVQVNSSGEKHISSVRLVSTEQPTDVLLWPNPAYDELHIRTQQFSSQYKARIYDKLGKILLTANLVNSNASIKIDQLKKGWYMVKLSSASGTEPEVTAPFIKN